VSFKTDKLLLLINNIHQLDRYYVDVKEDLDSKLGAYSMRLACSMFQRSYISTNRINLVKMKLDLSKFSTFLEILYLCTIVIRILTMSYSMIVLSVYEYHT